MLLGFELTSTTDLLSLAAGHAVREHRLWLSAYWDGYLNKLSVVFPVVTLITRGTHCPAIILSINKDNTRNIPQQTRHPGQVCYINSFLIRGTSYMKPWLQQERQMWFTDGLSVSVRSTTFINLSPRSVTFYISQQSVQGGEQGGWMGQQVTYFIFSLNVLFLILTQFFTTTTAHSWQTTGPTCSCHH